MKQIQKTFFALGTANSILITFQESKADLQFEEKIISILEQIKLKVLDLDDKLSVFKETSEISKINESAGKSLITVSSDTFRVIQKSVEYSEISNGVFDITIRPLSKLWGIGKKGNYIPSQVEIEKAKDLVNYKDIILKNESMQIGLRRDGQSIDLGGIAKGYAADEARSILIKNKITNAIINFGGTVIVIGDEKKIGVQNPDKKTGTPVGALKVKNKSIVTSGWYERYFLKDGKRYHHIIHPQTGIPADSGICSITVVGDYAMDLDALSTAIFVLGMEKGTHLLEQCNTEGIFILKSREVFVTQGLREQFSLINNQEVNNDE